MLTLCYCLKGGFNAFLFCIQGFVAKDTFTCIILGSQVIETVAEGGPQLLFPGMGYVKMYSVNQQTFPRSLCPRH